MNDSHQLLLNLLLCAKPFISTCKSTTLLRMCKKKPTSQFIELVVLLARLSSITIISGETIESYFVKYAETKEYDDVISPSLPNELTMEI